jgi:hypothetical protein
LNGFLPNKFEETRRQEPGSWANPISTCIISGNPSSSSISSPPSSSSVSSSSSIQLEGNNPKTPLSEKLQLSHFAISGKPTQILSFPLSIHKELKFKVHHVIQELHSSVQSHIQSTLFTIWNDISTYQNINFLIDQNIKAPFFPQPSSHFDSSFANESDVFASVPAAASSSSAASTSSSNQSMHFLPAAMRRHSEFLSNPAIITGCYFESKRLSTGRIRQHLAQVRVIL